jgi:hypothetical protein
VRQTATRVNGTEIIHLGVELRNVSTQPIARDQQVTAEEIAREHDDGLPDDPLMRHIVPYDLDLVDRSRLPLTNVPTQVHEGRAAATGPARLFGLDLGVDIAIVRVQVLDLFGGCIPL